MAGLREGVELRRGKRQRVQAEGVGRIGLRFRNRLTAGPDLRWVCRGCGPVDQKKETIAAFWGTFSERLAAVIAEAQATGELDPAIPTPVLQAIFTGLLHPANFSGSLLATEHPIPREELIGYLSQFFFRGAAALQPHQEGKGRLNERD